MPTNKPRVQSILEPDTYEKLKYITKQEMRSESQMIAYIINEYIKIYESEHGEISLDKKEG